MDTKAASDDSHVVCGERSGLVRADHGRVGHDLTRTEDADEEGLSCHPFRGECECECDCQWETLGDGDDDDRDCDDEDLGELHCLGVAGSAGVGLQVDEEPDHQGREEDEPCE